MLGYPKFTYEDEVEFDLDGQTIIGKVEVIDAYGTFFDHTDVSYDIMAEHNPNTGKPCLYKHICEKALKKVLK